MSREVSMMREWYKRFVLYEIFWSCGKKNNLNYREFQVLVPKHLRKREAFESIKVLHVTDPDNINYILQQMVKYETRKKPYGLYFSLATYEKGVPFTDPNICLPSRKIITEEWKETHHKQMIAYDCFIDVDSPDHDDLSMDAAKQSTYDLISHLDEFKVPYTLRFSGCGYHVIIPYAFFRNLELSFNPDDENNVYTFFNVIVHKLKNAYSDFVDDDIHDSRRVCKLPYSLAFYEDGCFVCWPFNTKDEFNHHHFEDYQLRAACHFVGETKIFKRGIVTYNACSVDMPQLVQPFLDSLKIKLVKDGKSKKNS